MWRKVRSFAPHFSAISKSKFRNISIFPEFRYRAEGEKMGRNPKWSMTHDITPKIIHRHLGNQKIKSDFPPAVPHWRYSPLYWGKSQIGPFPAKFKEKMQKKEEAPSHAGCTHDHEIKMKKIQILQETAKIKIIFRRRSPLGDFPSKVPKWAFSP